VVGVPDRGGIDYRDGATCPTFYSTLPDFESLRQNESLKVSDSVIYFTGRMSPDDCAKLLRAVRVGEN
jgi:hypothetical protein